VAWDYYRRLFKGRVELTAPPESYGTPNDGIIRVTAAVNHPNEPGANDQMQDVLFSTASQIEEHIDAGTFDKDGNGFLSPDELTVAFVIAGRSRCTGSCLDSDVPMVRGYARTLSLLADDEDLLILDGIKVPNYAVQPERGILSASGYKDTFAIATLIHELGHAVFGVSDHYGEYDNSDEFTEYLGDWCLLSDTGLRRPSDNQIGPQYFSGYTKLETNLIKAQAIEDSQVIGLDSAAEASLDDDGTDSSIARVWLDPYQVRESLVFEYRDNQGYDSFLSGEGAIVTRTQSLAANNKTAPPSYRRASLVSGGSGYDGAIGTGQVGEFIAQSDTPGYTDDPIFAPRTVTLRYDGVSNDRAFFDISVDEFGPPRGHLRYDEGAGDEMNIHSNEAFYGFTDEIKAYAGTLFVNTTQFDTIDGVELLVRDASSVTIEIYAGILDDDTPYDLLSTESFEFSTGGWHRAFFDNPVDFPPDEARFIVVGIETPSVTTFVLPYVLHNDRAKYEVQTFSSADGLRFRSADNRVYRQILLLSKQDG